MNYPGEEDDDMKYGKEDMEEDSDEDSEYEEEEDVFDLSHLAEGEVYSCGYGYFGQLGVQQAFIEKPIKIPNLTKIVRVAAGEAHSFAISTFGEVFAWGCNRYGQLGLGDRLHRFSPTLIEALDEIQVFDVVCGSQHSAVLSASGEIYTFGCGSLGRLGHGDHKHLSIPRFVSALRGKKVVQVACGAWFTIAVTSDGATYSWGCNRFGQIGHGKNSVQLSPRQISALHGKFIVKVTCGKHHSLFLTDNSEVYSLGAGMCGQLGTRNNKSQLIPTRIESLSGKQLVDITSGHLHNLALDIDKNVHAWGYFSEDHLGLPESGEEYFFHPFTVRTEALKSQRVAKVIAGGWHSAVISDAGELFTWGFNYRGRLGHEGKIDDSHYPLHPLPVVGLEDQNIVSVACGSSHTLIVAGQKPSHHTMSDKSM